MNTKPPAPVIASAALIFVVLLAGLALWVSSVTQVTSVRSAVQFISYPWFAVPLVFEVGLAVSLIVLIVRGWKWARIAVLMALLLWLPDIASSVEGSSGELAHSARLWFSWFAVIMCAAALALLFSRGARAHFNPRSAGAAVSDA